MFKNKNIVTKASNGLLIFMFVIMTISLISVLTVLINGDTTLIEGYTKSDYVYNSIISGIYMIFSGLTLYILNKRIDLYKDEYPVTKQVYNLFFMVAILGTIISVLSLITGYFVYKEFSFYSLLAVLSEALIFILSYKYLSKNELLSLNNSKKTNIINLIIIFLLLEYSTGIIKVLLQLIFGLSKTVDSIKYLLLYLIGIGVVVLAYRMFSKVKDKEVVEVKKEVKVVSTKENKTETPKKKVTKVNTKKKTNTKKVNKETKK